MELKNIGMAIKKCRKQNRLTLRDVSSVAGIDKSHLSRIEQGIYIPQIDTFAKIAYALNINPSKLMKMAEDMDSQNKKYPQ